MNSHRKIICFRKKVEVTFKVCDNRVLEHENAGCPGLSLQILECLLHLSSCIFEPFCFSYLTLFKRELVPVALRVFQLFFLTEFEDLKPLHSMFNWAYGKVRSL